MKFNFKLIRNFSNKIINFEKKTCVNCFRFIDFQPHKEYNKEYSLLGSCFRFPEKNVVTGTIYNNLASKCRSDENKCGINAKFFTPKTRICNKTL